MLILFDYFLTIVCEYITTIVASVSEKNQHDYIFANFKIHLC